MTKLGENRRRWKREKMGRERVREKSRDHGTVGEGRGLLATEKESRT